MMYEETYLTNEQIDDLAENDLYYNEEWDDFEEDNEDDPYDEEFWEHCDELEADPDFLPDRDEVPDYAYSYYFDFND